MIGLIHELLLDFVRNHGGDAAVAEVLGAVGLPAEQRFRIDRAYDDPSWQRLCGAVAGRLGMSAVDLNRRFGRHAADALAARFPGFFVGDPSVREMLRRQVMIHQQFARTMPSEEQRQQVAGKFQIVEDGEALVIRYRSPNDHLELYRGIADRLTELLGGSYELEVEDLRRGDGADYVLRLRFAGEPPKP